MLDLRHEPMSPVFDKWHVGGMPFAAVFHRFTEPDRGDPHDHPWPFRSTVLHGGYVEEVYDLASGSIRHVHRRPGDSFVIEPDHVHRIVELPLGECWTLIQPEGSKVREPGFYQWRDGVAFHRPWHRAEFLPMGEGAR